MTERTRIAQFSCACLSVSLLLLLVAGGCSQRTSTDKQRNAATAPPARPMHEPEAAVQPVQPTRASPSTPENAIAADPVAYLKRVSEKAAAISAYTVTFTRHERRGILNALQGPERITVWYRQTPLSIRMKWLDEEVKYGESTYVAGKDGDKVRFIPRHGFLGLTPTITSVDPQTPVTWGESRYPVTEFGVARLMARTLKSMAEAGDTVSVTYVELEVPPNAAKPAHHLRLVYAPDHKPAPQQDLFIDPATDLPVATIISHTDGRLEAAYYYEDLDPRVTLRDSDFLLDAERSPTPTAGAGTAAATASEQ